MGDIARYVADIVDAIRGRPARSPSPATLVEKPPAGAARAAPSTDRRGAGRTTPGPSTPAAPPPDSTTGDLTCPRCKQGPLLTGKRGWGCSRWRQGCSFVVWFEMAGRRLSAAQLRDPIAKGKTRKATWNPDGAPAGTPGRLILDLQASAPAGGARFEPS